MKKISMKVTRNLLNCKLAADVWEQISAEAFGRVEVKSTSTKKRFVVQIVKGK